MRRRVAKILQNYGKRIQYSVFECDIDEKRYRKLYAALVKETKDLKDGSIRFYYLCGNCIPKMVLIGQDMPSNYRDKDDIIVI